MKWATALLFIASLYVCAGLQVLVANEAKDDMVLKHISGWADVKYASVVDVISNGEAEIIVVDGSLFSKYSESLHSVLLQRSVPLIILNMTSEHKDIFMNQMTFGTPGASYLYAILPFTDRNKMRHHRVIDVPAKKLNAKIEKIDETGRKSTSKSVTFEINFDESAKMFSDEIFASVVNGVFDPPGNMTPPSGALYAILPFSVLGSYTVDLETFNKPGSQVVSHRLNNNFYNYRENGFGEDGYFTVLMQDAIVSPGQLVVDDPTQAVGFFQYMFEVANQPEPNGAVPVGNGFYWTQSSPATVNQVISVTNSVEESLSLEIDMSVDGPSSKVSVTWTASTSVTSEISQWGVVEDSDPVNSSTIWTYHQQLPYDIYELGYNNFANWYTLAYNGNNVASVPDLSTNTLQVHTISAWYAAGTLRNSDGTLPILTTSTREHDVAIICTPNYYNGHHELGGWNLPFGDSFKMDLNAFNSTMY